MTSTYNRPLAVRDSKVATYEAVTSLPIYQGSFLGFIPGTQLVRPLVAGDQFAGVVEKVVPVYDVSPTTPVYSVVDGTISFPYNATVLHIGRQIFASDDNTVTFSSKSTVTNTHIGFVRNVVVGQYLEIELQTGVSLETIHEFRGELRMDTYPGVVTGTVSAEQRVANFTAMQNAINQAYTEKKTLIVPPATYEIDGAAGLVIPAGYNGFEWKGSKNGTVICQYAVNAPALTVGVAGGAECAGVTIDGVGLIYGVDQTGQTSAALFKVGKTWKCYFRNISANSNGSIKPYYACHLAGNSFYFSNTMEDCSFRDAQVTSLYVQNFGTGNIFRNLYVTKGGAPTATAISGPVVRFDTGGGAQYGNVIEQLNIEWAIGNNLLQMQQVRNMTFISTHIEGCRISSANGTFIKVTGSQVTFIGLCMLNCGIKTADGAATAAYVIFGDYRNDVKVIGMVIWQDNVSYNGCEVPLYLTNNYSPNTYHLNNFSFDNFVLTDTKTGNPTTSNFKLNTYNANSGYDFGAGTYLRLMKIECAPPLSTVKGGYIDIADADKTLYGFAESVQYAIPGTLASSRTLTLSNRMGPGSTNGANIPLPAGRTVAVNRAGTASGSNAVVNNHDGSLLATMSTTNQLEHFYFNGTDWVKI